MASAPQRSRLRRKPGAVLPQPHPAPGRARAARAGPARAAARRGSAAARRAAAAGAAARAAARARLRAACSQRAPASSRAACAPASPDFSGWNWVALTSPSSTAATNGSPCTGARHQPRRVVRGVGVHEVEPGVRGRGRRTASSPAHASTVFQPMCGSTGARSGSTRPGQHARARRSRRRARRRRRTAPACRRRCRAPAAAPRSRVGDDRRRRRPRPARPCRRRTRRRPGTTRPSASTAARAVGGDRDVGPDPFERALGRAQVARPVVEHDDAWSRG